MFYKPPPNFFHPFEGRFFLAQRTFFSSLAIIRIVYKYAQVHVAVEGLS